MISSYFISFTRQNVSKKFKCIKKDKECMTMKLSVQLILLSFYTHRHTLSHLSPGGIVSASVYPREMSHSLPVGPSHPISEKPKSTIVES